MGAKWVITGIALAAAVGLARARRALSGRSGAMESALVVIFVLLLIWLGRLWRDGVVVGAVLLVGLLAWGGVATLVTTAVVGLLAWVIPGGTSVIVLGLVGIISISVGFDYLRLVDRIDRAQKLVPGQRPSGDVVLSGKALATAEVTLPIGEVGKLAWYRLTVGPTVLMSEALLEIRTAAGTALVDPKGVTFTIHGDARSLNDDECKQVLGRPPLALEVGRGAKLVLIAEGTDVFVMGAPDWEASPRAEVSYREAPLLPVFRAGERRPVVVEDLSDKVVRGDKLWALFAWMGWGALCSAVAIMQLTGAV